MRIALIDVETTGEDPSVDQICEFAVGVMSTPDWNLTSLHSALCAISVPMKPEARAAHHIHPDDLTPTRCYPAPHNVARMWPSDLRAVAAHHAAFDLGFVRPLLDAASLPLPPVIDTWRAAMHLWPDAPRYKLQVLRYWLDLPHHRSVLIPHRAEDDVVVLSSLLRRMLEAHTVDDLITLSTAPVLQSAVSFGEHRGKPWSEVPRSYMRWMARKLERNREAFDEDARYTLGRWLRTPRGAVVQRPSIREVIDEAVARNNATAISPEEAGPERGPVLLSS